MYVLDGTWTENTQELKFCGLEKIKRLLTKPLWHQGLQRKTRAHKGDKPSISDIHTLWKKQQNICLSAGTL